MKFLYQDSQISAEEIAAAGKSLAGYIERLNNVARAKDYSLPEGFINLPGDRDLANQIREICQSHVSSRLKYVVVIGIGGSNLGARAVYDALYGYFDLLEPERSPKIIFADTNDPEFSERLVGFIKHKLKDPEEILVNIISKSGGTFETTANANLILGTLLDKFKNIADRVVVTTDFKSKLWRSADKAGLTLLAVPAEVGGRFSVFSAVGLLPLSTVGLGIKELLKGAVSMREQCLSESILKNPAAISAIVLFLNYRRRKVINDNFFFHPELESLGKWYRQLLAESIGKDGLGLTATVSVGSSDLHSVGQLNLGGPKDKITTFVWSENSAFVEPSAGAEKLGFEPVSRPFAEVMSAILEGAKNAYRGKELPFVEIVMPDLSLESLGEFMQFKMMEVCFLAKLFNVNGFDQPEVELYKKEIHRFLED
ncbi:MAG: hypothetical protein HY454_04115 [Parcubacteria group bacterium]|nr:hypothetical protein [Parcubacteria group bacterium]